MDLHSEIRKLAKEKNAVILAHNYVLPEVQDVADYTGDSLELARIAAKNSAEIIVFAGVHFMAESASMLSPTKKVLLPALNAGCPMADMAEAADVVEMKKKYPNAKVVTYINSTAAVKAVSDVCCTSSNARRIVERIDGDQILFLPDKNLASYVQRFTTKEIIPWNGFCPIHAQFSAVKLAEIKAMYPGAKVMVHPECPPDVVDLADEVLSTGEMVKFVETFTEKQLIVATELGMIHRLKKANPNIEYIAASPDFICPNMKKNNLETIYTVLRDESNIITVPPEIAEKAVAALELMLKLSY